MLPALVGGFFCALLAQYLALRALIRLGVPRTREVDTGQAGDPSIIQQQRTPASLVVDAVAYLGGFFGIAYLIQFLRGV